MAFKFTSVNKYYTNLLAYFTFLIVSQESFENQFCPLLQKVTPFFRKEILI
ncbi:MAG TPA: hypothetical protein VLI68_08500 [Hanamia sp.]|nr:hypothetical protein [Hanamia sp.]